MAGERSLLVPRRWLQCKNEAEANATSVKIMQWNVLADGKSTT